MALLHFNNFLHPETAETILLSIRGGRISKLLDQFVSDQSKRVAVISYLGWHDIEIVPSKLDRKLIDAAEIRVLKCNNQVLKTSILRSNQPLFIEAREALRDWIILKYKGRVQTPEGLASTGES